MTTSEVAVRRLFLDTLDVSELFTDLVEIFDIVVTTRNVNGEFSLLCSKLYLQRLRLVIWGEALGLIPSLEEAGGHIHCTTNQLEELKPSLIEIINDFYHVVDSSGVFVEQFQFQYDDLQPLDGYKKPPTTFPGLPIFHDRYENTKARHKRIQLTQNSTWTTRRWTVYDAENFAETVDRFEDVLDTLEDTTSSWGILEQQQTLLKEEIYLINDSSSLQHLGEIINSRQGSRVLAIVPEAVRHALARIARPENLKNAISNPTNVSPNSRDSFKRYSDLSISSLAKIAQSRAEIMTLLPISTTNHNIITIKSAQDVASRFDPAHTHCFPSLKPSLPIPTAMTVASVTTRKLCNACNNISLPMLVHGFRHALGYQEVLRNKDCCQFCALMMHGYNTQICMNHTKRSCEKNGNGRLTWKVVPPGPGARAGVFRLDLFHHSKSNSIHISEDSSLFKNQILTRRDVQVADSPRNFRLLRNWLEDCRLGHDECQYGSYSGQRFDDVSGTTILPFRVIDVGTGDVSSPPHLLITSNEMAGRYLTLSHCWGKETPTKTSKATLSTWLVALPEKELSKTFQDAIRLTRELGEQFLWIDSLCIVQDDSDDLKSQIGLMGAIFESAYCTIAAVDAKGDGSLPDRGLFLSGPNYTNMARMWLRYPSVVNRTQNHTPCDVGALEPLVGATSDCVPTELHEVSIELLSTSQSGWNSGVTPSQIESKAWNSRGWIFQEKELSRRCIFFTEEAFTWGCSRFWENEQTGVPERREYRSASNISQKQTLAGITHDTHTYLRIFWETSVRNYSQTALTYVSDKSNALKGLEERLITRHGARFIYGLLAFGPKEVIHSQLLWIPTVSRGSSLRGSPDFVCPTWSWMIIDGSVRWTSNEYVALTEPISDIDFDTLDADGTETLHISGPYQAVVIGDSIDEIPRCSRSERWPPGVSDWPALMLDSGSRSLICVDNGEVIGWAVLDSSDEPPDTIAVPLLQCLRSDDENEPMCVEFLLLAKVPILERSLLNKNRDVHYRVGRGRVLNDAFAWLENCQKRKFVVV